MYCRALSSFVAFVLCIGGPVDRVIVAIAAYSLPAFPAKVRKKRHEDSSEGSGEDCEPGVNWSFDEQMAKACGVQINDPDNAEIVDDVALDEDLEDLFMADSHGSLESVPDTLQIFPAREDQKCDIQHMESFISQTRTIGLAGSIHRVGHPAART